MTDYKDYSAEDFAKDEFFRNWVRNPRSDYAPFWQNWIKNNPDKIIIIQRAKALVLAFDDLFQDTLTPEQITHEINLLQLKASLSEKSTKPAAVYPFYLRIAAVLILIAGLSYAAFIHFQNNDTPALPDLAITSDVQAPHWISRMNNQPHPETIILNDGSEVILGENSTLHYLSDYRHTSERLVYLTGDAFFDVAKDSLHPFLVFAGTTVTRVLGTSFRIQSSSNKVEIKVSTGKVAVHRLHDYKLHSSHPSQEIPGVILSPNDKAVFEPAQESFNTSRLRPDEVIVIPRTHAETEFANLPVAEVLDSLSNTYSVDIEYNKKELSNCRINTMFKDETLLQKVRLVCMAIGAEYSISNGNIVIGPAECP